MCLGKTDDLSKSRLENEQSRRHCFIVSACVRFGEIDLSGGSRLFFKGHSNKNGKNWQIKRRKRLGLQFQRAGALVRTDRPSSSLPGSSLKLRVHFQPTRYGHSFHSRRRRRGYGDRI